MTPTCPSCGASAADIRFREKRADWFCDACDHSWAGAAPDGAVDGEPAAALAAPAGAAFISYGHADATEFVQRLKADLEEHGVSPVWLDSEMIAAGGVWTVSIEQGIRDADTLLAIMTPQALRDDSICHDEVALAATEGKRVVPVRIDPGKALRPSLLLVRRSWVDFSDDYDGALERLVRALRGDEGGLSHPLRTVSGQRPLDFAFDIAERSRGFMGRAWLVRELEKWLASDAGRAFVIIGEPGIGKSAIAAHLAQRSDAAAVHFCSTGNSDSLAPLAFVANLVATLGPRLPEFGAEVARRHPEEPRQDAVSAFRHLVVEPAHAIAAPASPQLVIVDALDEAATREGETIVDLIAAHAAALPSWLRIVATSRPETGVTQRLKALSPVELAALREENLEDLAAYLGARLAAVEVLSASDRAEAVRALAEKAAGNFLYAKMAADALLQGALTPEDLGRLPDGIDAFYAMAFARAFPETRTYVLEQAPVLRALAVAFGPMPFDVLAAASAHDPTTLNQRLAELRPYLKMEGRGSAATYALYHRSLGEWLTDRDLAGVHWCDAKAGHEQMTAALATAPATNDYAVRCLPRHLLALDRRDDLVALLAEPEFLEAALERDQFEVRRSWAVLADAGFSAAETYGPVIGAPETPETVLRALGTLLHDLGALDGAQRVYERREEIARAHGDDDALRAALGRQALIRRRRGDLEGAMALHKEEERISRELGDRASLQASLGNQALILRRRGDLDGAMALHKEEESICRALGDLDGLQVSFGNQALILRRGGDLDGAMTLFKEKERICRELANPGGLQIALGGQGLLLRELGDPDGAMALQKEKERICREFHILASLEIALGDQAAILRDRGDLDEALVLLAEKQRICRELGNPVGLQESLRAQASIALTRGQREEAERLIAQALSFGDSHAAVTKDLLKLRDDIEGLPKEE